MQGLVLVFLFLCSRFICSIKMEVEDPEAEEPSSESTVKINFASVSAGAVVLEKCKASKGYGNLLSDDKDKYGIAPCSEKKWLIIGLSEDVLVRTIVMENYEKYSSLLHEFQVLGSTSYPSSSWHDFGVYAAEAKLGAQEFNLTTPAWARYLKFRFLSQHGSEFYCTLSQIKVYGSTVLETFKREVEISELEMLNMRNSIQMETQLHSATPPAAPTSSDLTSSLDTAVHEEPKAGLPVEVEAPSEVETREVSLEGETAVAADAKVNVVSKAADALGVVRNAVLTPLMSVLAHNASSDRNPDLPSPQSPADSDATTSGGDVAGSSEVWVKEIATGLPPVEELEVSVPMPNGTLIEEVSINISGSASIREDAPQTIISTPSSSPKPGEAGESINQPLAESVRAETESADGSATEPLMNESKAPSATSSEPLPSSSPEIPDNNTSSPLPPPPPNSSSEANVSAQGNTTTGTSPGITPSNQTSEEYSLKRSADLNCIDILKYSAFKARMLSKISIDVEKNAVTSQDNVFKLLMQKIKVLETNTAIIELYASQLYECYRLHAINMTISLDIQNDTRRTNRSIEYEVFSQVALQLFCDYLPKLYCAEIYHRGK